VALGRHVEHLFPVMILAFRSFRMAIALALLSGATFSIADACPSSNDIDELRGQLAKQQAEIRQQQDQINELRRMMGEQARMMAEFPDDYPSPTLAASPLIAARIPP
jgi:septal ring factor EnvC (AmiA/AmiB activator)